MSAAKVVALGAIVLCCVVALASCRSQGSKTGKTDVVSGATPWYAGGDRGPVPPAGEGYEVLGVQKGIKNWAIRYDATLIRGGEFYDDAAADVLKEWGVKTIISIAPNDRERDFCKRHGFALVELPFDKAGGPSAEQLRKFLDTVQHGQGPFYVHCVGGAHRGGVLGFAYRLHVLKWPVEKALIEFGRLGGSLKDDHAMLEAVRSFRP